MTVLITIVMSLFRLLLVWVRVAKLSQHHHYQYHQETTRARGGWHDCLGVGARSTCFFFYVHLTYLKQIINFWICTWLVETEYSLFRVFVQKYVICKLIALFITYYVQLFMNYLNIFFLFLRITWYIIFYQRECYESLFCLLDLEKTRELIQIKYLYLIYKKRNKIHIFR